MAPEIPSLSDKISWRFLVPSMFLSVVWDSSLRMIQHKIYDVIKG